MGNSIPKRKILDAIRVISDEMFSILSERGSISVRNFGSFNPRLTEARKAVKIGTNEEFVKPRYWNIKFHPSNAIKEILKRKKHTFAKKS